MAEQNQEDTGPKFCSEILSPSELFSARSRSHKIPIRGQKDFYPKDSAEQQQRLQQSLKEHWGLVSEERVERLGNLVRATWIPSERIVELQSPAGKFWQTMGFSVRGKQCLLPEEALYLMECGSVQVFHQDLPLSIQDGYERFLSPDTVNLQQYQVFGHLKRLGFVVHRFDASSEPSSYARQLNLPLSRDRAGRSLKRKRSDSPSPSSSHTEAQEASHLGSAEAQEGEKRSESQSTSSPATSGAQSTLPGQSRGRPWWPTELLSAAGHEADEHTRGSSSSWDNSIIFPDLGSLRRSSSCLSSPDPSLLPGGLTVGGCDLTPWMGRINQHEVKMSAKERQRDKRRRRNRDKKVRDCRNWAEYHQLMASRRGRHSGRPSHLWRKEVAPLHDPTQPISTGELLDKISVIKSTHLLERVSSIKASDQWRISFSVYQPDTVADFKKSNPGKPYVRMCVCSFNGPTPDLRAIKQLTFQSADTPMVFAVVDHGDISFYTCKDFQLPKDVYP
ncbi:tRNA-splicing endonuclease subunit Sen54 isoform X1 [Entelurus aequoreus]|uniref:tRNA-splicing endonuclease subunit Sen54 isoform X1 n=2 Tax=Entelurus aequoreus TaxID=161455 RepID=UPI002B1E6928|nr:tRNA-splicing endonuclease subunit Sen54 isoform X1 [Entelurus aequoreus]